MSILHDWMSVLGAGETVPEERLEIVEGAEYRNFEIGVAAQMVSDVARIMLGGDPERHEKVQHITRSSDTVLANSVTLAEEADMLRGMTEGDQLGGLHSDSSDAIVALTDAMHAEMVVSPEPVTASKPLTASSDLGDLRARIDMLHARPAGYVSDTPPMKYEPLASELTMDRMDIGSAEERSTADALATSARDAATDAFKRAEEVIENGHLSDAATAQKLGNETNDQFAVAG